MDAALDQIASHALAHDAQHRLVHEVPKLTNATVHVSPTSNDATDYQASLTHHQHQ